MVVSLSKLIKSIITIKNIQNNKVKDKEVFFKMAPLLDPFKYLVGKYNAKDDKLFTLPQINSTENDCHPKFLDQNNKILKIKIIFLKSGYNWYKF